MPPRVALFVIATALAVQTVTHAQQPAPTQTGPNATAAARSPSTPAAVRHPEEGRPSFRNYVPREFALNTQNWAMVQDTRGVLYVGTNSGGQAARRPARLVGVASR